MKILSIMKYKNDEIFKEILYNSLKGTIISRIGFCNTKTHNIKPYNRTNKKLVYLIMNLKERLHILK